MRQKLTTVQYLEAAERFARMEAPLYTIAAEIGVSDSTLHRKLFGDSEWSRKHHRLLPDIGRMRAISRFWQWTSNAKIKPHQVAQIRALRGQGTSYAALAQPVYWILGEKIYAASEYVEVQPGHFLAVGGTADEVDRQFDGHLFILTEIDGHVDIIGRFSIDVAERIISMLTVALNQIEERKE